MKNAIAKREAAPAVVQDGKVDFTEVIVEGGGLADGHAAERVRLHLAAALELGRRSIAHAVAAGWELACQKALLGYGGWGRWCRQELGFSQDTADRYIELFRKTVGAARAVAGIAEESTLTRDEVEKATVAVDAATVTGAMIALNIVKRNGKWGGVREGSGRPAKDPAPPPPDVAAHRDWAGVLDPLSRLTDVSFRFLPLEDARLALDALDAARARLKARVAELTGPGVRPGDWDAPEDGGEA